jgi:hypothetical protein
MILMSWTMPLLIAEGVLWVSQMQRPALAWSSIDTKLEATMNQQERRGWLILAALFLVLLLVLGSA